MWYDNDLKANGYISWSVDDLKEFNSRPYEGMEFIMHRRKWVIISLTAFSSMCKIALKEDIL